MVAGGDAGGRRNHADNQDVRLLPKNPIGFDGDNASGRGHVRMCIVSACEPAATRCVQHVLAYGAVGRGGTICPFLHPPPSKRTREKSRRKVTFIEKSLFRNGVGASFLSPPPACQARTFCVSRLVALVGCGSIHRRASSLSIACSADAVRRSLLPPEQPPWFIVSSLSFSRLIPPTFQLSNIHSTALADFTPPLSFTRFFEVLGFITYFLANFQGPIICYLLCLFPCSPCNMVVSTTHPF